MPTTGAGLAAPNSGCTATNILPQSSNLAGTDWALGNASLPSSTITDPFGTNNAFELEEDGTNNNHQDANAIGPSVTGGVTTIISTYVSRGSSNDRDIRLLIISPDVVWISIW